MAGKGGSKRLEVPKELPEIDSKKSLNLDPTAARVIRLYLERVATELDRQQGSPAYRSANKYAARCIRALKPD